jgi:hypothetical protein
LPAAAWYFPFHLLFVFSLAERKNEQQREDNVPPNAFVRLGICAEGVRNPPIWLQITAPGQVIPAAPPHIKGISIAGTRT